MSLTNNYMNILTQISYIVNKIRQKKIACCTHSTNNLFFEIITPLNEGGLRVLH